MLFRRLATNVAPLCPFPWTTNCCRQLEPLLYSIGNQTRCRSHCQLLALLTAYRYAREKTLHEGQLVHTCCYKTSETSVKNIFFIKISKDVGIETRSKISMHSEKGRDDSMQQSLYILTSVNAKWGYALYDCCMLAWMLNFDLVSILYPSTLCFHTCTVMYVLVTDPPCIAMYLVGLCMHCNMYV